MKSISVIALSASLVAGQVTAGALSDPIIEAPVIVEEAQSSSSGLIVPLFLLAVVAIAISKSSSGGMGTTVIPGPVGTISDVRLKTDIVQVGHTAFDLPLCQFRYISGSQTFEGVMAQDVVGVMPSAVVPSSYGLLAVDYGALGIGMRAVD